MKIARETTYFWAPTKATITRSANVRNTRKGKAVGAVMRLREGEKKSRKLRRPCGHGKEKRQGFFFALVYRTLPCLGLGLGENRVARGRG